MFKHSILFFIISIFLFSDAFYFPLKAPAAEPEMEAIQKYPILEKAAELLKQGNLAGAKSVYVAYLNSLLKAKTQDTVPLIAAWVGLAHIAENEYDFPAAQRELEEALELAPKNGTLYAELGKLYQHWWKAPGNTNPAYQNLAETNFQKAEKISPDDYAVLTDLGGWALDTDDRAGAEHYLQRAIEIKPDYIPAYQNLAKFYIAAEDYERARDTMLHAIEIDPDDGESYFILAQLLAKADHPDKALENALKSETMDPGQNPDRDMLIGQMYETLGKLNEATTYYEKVSVLSPHNAELNMKLADLYDRLKQNSKSAQYFSSASVENPAMIQGYMVQAENALRTEQTADARKLLRKVFKLTASESAGGTATDKPQFSEDRQEALHAFSTSHYADYLNMQVNPDEIAEDLTHLGGMANDSRNTDPLLQLDMLKLKIAQHGDITPEISDSLKRIADGNSPLAAGEALFLLGDYNSAQEKLDAFEGANAQAYISAADRLMLEREYTAAQSFYQRAKDLIRSEGKNSDLSEPIQQGLTHIQAKQSQADQLLKDGNQLYDQKEYAEAIRRYRSAIRLDPERNGAYMRLGDTYEKTGDRTNAFKAYDNAVKLNPALLQSSAFKKKYEKLRKHAKNAPTQPAPLGAD